MFPRFHLFGKFKFVDFGNVDLPELRVLGLVNYAINASKCVDRQLRKTSIMLAARPVLKSKYFEPPFPFSLFVSLMLVRGREGPCIPSPLPPPVPPSGRAAWFQCDRHPLLYRLIRNVGLLNCHSATVLPTASTRQVCSAADAAASRSALCWYCVRQNRYLKITCKSACFRQKMYKNCTKSVNLLVHLKLDC